MGPPGPTRSLAAGVCTTVRRTDLRRVDAALDAGQHGAPEGDEAPHVVEHLNRPLLLPSSSECTPWSRYEHGPIMAARSEQRRMLRESLFAPALRAEP